MSLITKMTYECPTRFIWSKLQSFIFILLFFMNAQFHLQNVLGAAGDLDSSFNGSGKVLTDFGGENNLAYAVIVQPDGKIVAVGSAYNNGISDDFALVRYNPDGSLDLTFGNSGQVVTDFDGGNDKAFGVAIQSDGGILATGYVTINGFSDFALCRYDINGSLDTSFGNNGKVTTDFGAEDVATSVALHQDGRIVIGGHSAGDFALARYNIDGSLDLSFGSNGKVTTDFAGYNDEVFAVAVQPDDKIVAGGNARIGDNYNFGLARYNSNGSLDPAFGMNGGLVTTDFGATADWAYSMAVQPDGKIVLAGNTFTGISIDFALTRHTSDGYLDVTFGGDGKVTTEFSGYHDLADAVSITPDGKIVAAGFSWNGVNGDFAVSRYFPNGNIDTAFGVNGKVTTDFNGFADEVYAISVQTDGKVVAAGTAWGGSSMDFALIRYIGEPSYLFFDTFDDGNIADWSQIKPTWTESGSSLVGTPISKKAIVVAAPVFSGCQICTIETVMQTSGGELNKIWLLGWYVYKQHTIELIMKQESGKWILKQRSNGTIVAKTKGIKPIVPNQNYMVKIAFDGSVFQVFIDDSNSPLIQLVPQSVVLSGIVGFEVKNTTGRFDFIAVD